jgi:hypothetical protein
VASVRPGDPDDPDDEVETEDLAPVAALVDDVAAEEDPEVACVAVDEVLPEFVAVVVLVPLWLAPGSVKATTPVASTPATPTPAVTADSRFMPRLRAAPAVAGRSAG